MLQRREFYSILGKYYWKKFKLYKGLIQQKTIEGSIQKQWNPHLKVVFHFYFNGRGQFSFHFQLNNNQDCVFHNGPWFMRFCSIYLSSWFLYFDPKEEFQQISPFRSTSLTFLSSPQTPKPWRQLQNLYRNVFKKTILMLVCILVLVFQFQNFQK